MSFTGLAKDAVQAISLFISGWFMRNLRSPSRRTMIAEITNEDDRKKAYGILHALDVGGGVLGITYLTLFLYFKTPFTLILPFTAIPITIGTSLVALSKSGQSIRGSKQNTKVILGILIATALLGIGTYSPGFPIITVTQSTHEIYLGALTYGIYLGSSAFFGYVFSYLRIRDLYGLVIGYFLAFLANLGFALLFQTGAFGLYLSVFVLGIAFAAAETFEPSIISKASGGNMGRQMGLLSLSRGVGYFIANSVMGALYSLSYSYAYLFAATMSIVSVIIALILIRSK